VDEAESYYRLLWLVVVQINEVEVDDALVRLWSVSVKLNELEIIQKVVADVESISSMLV
jgi:hypothetical protein